MMYTFLLIAIVLLLGFIAWQLFTFNVVCTETYKKVKEIAYTTQQQANKADDHRAEAAKAIEEGSRLQREAVRLQRRGMDIFESPFKSFKGENDD